MKNFGRALRLALRYRWTLAASVVSALLVAVLWGGNIGTVYPLVEVSLENRSLHDWVDDKVAEIEKKTAELNDRVAVIDRAFPTAPAAEQNKLLDERVEKNRQIEKQQSALSYWSWLRDSVVGPYLPDEAFQSLMLILGLLFVGTVVKSVFVMLHAILVGRMVQLAVLSLRKTFYRRTLKLDLARFGNENTGDLMNRFTSDVDSLATGLAECLGKLVREPLKMVACMVGAACVCWRLLLVSLVLAPVAAYLIRRLAKALKKANRRAMEEMSQMYGLLDETFQGIKAVKAFTMERYERRRFHENGKKYYHRLMRIIRYDALSNPLTEVLGILTIGLAILAGAYLSINGHTHLLGIRISEQPLGLTSLMVFFAFLAGMADPARKLSDVFSRIQRGAAAADRIYQFIDREPTIVDPPRPVPIARHHRDLVFEGVSFGYAPGHPVIEGVDLRIPYGETLAIVGPNGCGKSTLANLIPRFFDPTSGTVRLDGVNLRDLRMRDLRSQIGLVTQETLLFDDTVFNNIRYGSLQATREEVIQAAMQAHAHRFIEERLSDGYNTIVGARGSSLSGGQRQRIALARAILRDPAILILDEATSQVDLESEQVIQKVLEQFTRQRTTVIITHRMSVLALAHRIVVMNAGRILDIGTHDQLLRRCDLYGRLNDLQFKETA